LESSSSGLGHLPSGHQAKGHHRFQHSLQHWEKIALGENCVLDASSQTTATPSPGDQCASGYFRDYSDLNLNSSLKLAGGKEQSERLGQRDAGVCLAYVCPRHKNGDFGPLYTRNFI
jgi:hypothetical protein